MIEGWNLAIDLWKKLVTEINIDVTKPQMPGYAITREDYDGR
jgi:hypothetical protein